MAKVYRPVTDGSGQEIVNHLEALLSMLQSGTTVTVTASDYTDKSLLTEATGRDIASKLASLTLAFKTYIAPQAKKVSNKLTIGSSTYDGSAALTAPTATQSAAGLLSAADKVKLDGIASGAQVNAVTGVKGNAETTYRTGNVNLTPANIGAATSGHTHSAATTSAAGFMSASDKTKLDGLKAYKAGQGLSLSGDTFSLKTLEDMGWDEISAISQAGKAPSIFHVGQEKKITLSTGESVTAVILGFNHDDLAAGGKAGITFGLKNSLKTGYTMNSSATNAGGWTSSAMRTRMATFKGYLPSALQSAILSVTKKTSAGEQSTTINTTTDDLFLFSHVEVFGTNYYDQGDSPTMYSIAGEGKQYEYFKGKTWCSYYSKTTVDSFGTARSYTANRYYQENSYKGLGDTATSAYVWWLRSSSAANSSSFCYVYDTGRVYYTNASSSIGVCFGFCV